MEIFKGDIIYAKSLNELVTIPKGYIAVENGLVSDVFEQLPPKYSGAYINDFGDSLIIPSFVDLHLHAPQYTNIGLGLDKPLLEWLRQYTFPEEAKFSDIEYAKEIYTAFVNELIECGSLRSVVFATVHKNSTELLFGLFEKAGISGYIGKVNMDYDCDVRLIEDTEKSINHTIEIIEKQASKSSPNPLVKPIITPRFAPVCSEKLLKALSLLCEKYGLPVQTHISESLKEIELVENRFNKSYSEVYDEYGFLGEKTILAHCVHNYPFEIDLFKKRGVTVAHCPVSNTGLSSGIAPIKKYLGQGLNIGLGSDISGGHSMFMPANIAAAIEASKHYSIYVDRSINPLTVTEAFYLATKGGGRFFGKVSSFEKGYMFDALIIDDKIVRKNQRTLFERLCKFIYTGSKHDIIKRYLCGKET